MFIVLLVVLLAAACFHAVVSRRRSREAVAELILVYILVGYCGVAMLAASAFSLIAEDRVAAWLGFPPDNPFQRFLGFAFLGMAVAAVLSARYRQSYLIGPVVTWSVFFAGATYVHLADLGQREVGHGTVLHVFATHTTIPVLLVGLLAASGAVSLRRPGSDTEPRPGGAA